jgi:2-(1,2-epoxy-1,2-dihydrophenyl)acetyl-CoA isomerase
MIGRARAMEMALLGDKIPAETALAWGLVNRVTEDADLLATARGLAAALASGPRSLGLIRQLIWDGEDNDWERQLQAERRAQAIAGASSDFAEGVRAFLDKRPPNFTGG